MFIDTNAHRNKQTERCTSKNDNDYLCGGGVTEKTKKISTLFLLYKNMIKSSQILSIENTICSKWSIGKTLELRGNSQTGQTNLEMTDSTVLRITLEG